MSALHARATRHPFQTVHDSDAPTVSEGNLYNAHDKVGHQGIAKVLQRIQERHTWPGIRKDITEYIKRCYTCQEVRHPAGNQCYPLQNITSSGFNDLVQFDHMKVCKSDSGNSGLLVIIDHFSKFAEAVPCAYDQYDAISTAESLLTKWVARHGTPTRMQSDNAAAFNSVIMNHFMAASHVTKGLIHSRTSARQWPRRTPKSYPVDSASRLHNSSNAVLG